MEKTWQRIYSKKNVLLYEGFTVSGKPFGAGASYYKNGCIYQEGVFDVKGLVHGREYYPSGKLRFEGTLRVNSGYGPNYPVFGTCYDENGNICFEGKLTVSRSGLGYPKIEKPEEFGPIPQKHPKLNYFMWEDRNDLN